MMSVLEVSCERLAANVQATEQVLRIEAGSWEMPALLGVVKADGYGHSATLCAPMLAAAGVRWLGVTDADEGRAVRESVGEDSAEILVMSGPPGEVADARQAARLAVGSGLTPVIWTVPQMHVLAAAALERPIRVHVEVDTGMSRQGVRVGPDLDVLLHAMRGEMRVQMDGVMTHLASAECADGRQTTGQMELLETAVRRVAEVGFRPRWVHVGNASTIDNGAVDAVRRLCELASEVGARAMVRCGLGLYGLCLQMDSAGQSRLRALLQPVLTWRTAVVSVMEVPAGETIGYGGSYTARRAMRVALLPVGYADGLRRGLSGTNQQSGGWVMIQGQRAWIVGRVSMNLTTVDVTDFEPAVEAGERVVLLGEGISAEDHAELCGALPYEILCGLRGRHIAG